MAGHLNQHRDDPAVLLLYLSDELDEAEQQGVEARLAADHQFAALLKDLCQIDSQVRELVGSDLEGAAPDPQALKHLAREMARRHTELVLRSAQSPGRVPRRHWPWYAQAAVAVAAVFFIFLGLWSFGVIDSDPGLPPVDPRIATPIEPAKPVSTDALLALLEQSLDPSQDDPEPHQPEGPQESINDLLL